MYNKTTPQRITPHTLKTQRCSTGCNMPVLPHPIYYTGNAGHFIHPLPAGYQEKPTSHQCFATYTEYLFLPANGSMNCT